MTSSLSALRTTTDQLQTHSAVSGQPVQIHSRKPVPPPLRNLNPARSEIKQIRKTQLRTIPGNLTARTRNGCFRAFAPPALDLSCSSTGSVLRSWTPRVSVERNLERAGRHLGDLGSSFSLAKVLGEVACSRELLQQAANMGLGRARRCSPTHRQSPAAAQRRSPVRFLLPGTPPPPAAPPRREQSPEVRYLPGCGLAAVRERQAVRLRGLNSRCAFPARSEQGPRSVTERRRTSSEPFRAASAPNPFPSERPTCWETWFSVRSHWAMRF